MIEVNKYIGCFLGLACGDSFGAPYEGGVLERLLWRLLGKTNDGRYRYTDDTQMAIDIAISYLENSGINQEHLAKTFTNNYRWSRGYGPSAASLLKKIRAGSKWKEVNRLKFKDGSYGNGAAMRAPIVAMCFPSDIALLRENVVKTSEITHAHKLAVEGAQNIAYAVLASLQGVAIGDILEALISQSVSTVFREEISICNLYIKDEILVSANEVRSKLGNGIAATDSCVTAIYFGLAYKNMGFEEMVSEICKVGGDADTIASMAGAIWGAANGCEALLSLSKRVENSERIIELAGKIHSMNF